jgi:hypothetical protein
MSRSPAIERTKLSSPFCHARKWRGDEFQYHATWSAHYKEPSARREWKPAKAYSGTGALVVDSIVAALVAMEESAADACVTAMAFLRERIDWDPHGVRYRRQPVDGSRRLPLFPKGHQSCPPGQ